jgi:hypothetical protein
MPDHQHGPLRGNLPTGRLRGRQRGGRRDVGIRGAAVSRGAVAAGCAAAGQAEDGVAVEHRVGGPDGPGQAVVADAGSRAHCALVSGMSVATTPIVVLSRRTGV